jgi:hypothetical protein
MKHLFLFLLFAGIQSQVAAQQNETSSTSKTDQHKKDTLLTTVKKNQLGIEIETKHDPLRANRWSLILKSGISNDYDVTFLSNQDVTFKYHFSPIHAVRMDVSYAGKARFPQRYISRNLENGTSYYPETRTDVEGTNQEYYFSSSFLYIDYKRIKEPVKFYYGAGILAFVDSYMNDTKTYSNLNEAGIRGPEIASRNQSTISTGAGIAGLIGIEYFFTDYMSVIAEYNTALYYQHWITKSRENDYQYSTTSPDLNARVETNSVRSENRDDLITVMQPQFKFGVQFYF